MTLELIKQTNLKWFMLVNILSSIAFLPPLNHYRLAAGGRGAVLAPLAYGGTWLVSGFLTGLLDARSATGLHRETGYASFMFAVAIYLLLAGKLIWPATLPLPWPFVLGGITLSLVAILVLQLMARRRASNYTKAELFN